MVLPEHEAVEVEAVAVHDGDGWVCRRVWRFVVPVLPDELESALTESTVEELVVSSSARVTSSLTAFRISVMKSLDLFAMLVVQVRK